MHTAPRHFRVIVHGRQAESPSRGFYTARCIEAATENEAIAGALDRVAADPKLEAITSAWPGDRALEFEIEEVVPLDAGEDVATESHSFIIYDEGPSSRWARAGRAALALAVAGFLGALLYIVTVNATYQGGPVPLFLVAFTELVTGVLLVALLHVVEACVGRPTWVSRVWTAMEHQWRIMGVIGAAVVVFFSATIVLALLGLL